MNRLLFLIVVGLFLFFVTGCGRPDCTAPSGHAWSSWQQDPAVLGRNGFDQARQVRFCHHCGLCQGGWH